MKYIPWCIEKLDEIIQLWNSEIGDQFPLREDLLIQNSYNDENILPNGSFLCLNERGDVIGFILAKKWQEKIAVNINAHIGWIQVLLVNSNFRNQGIGTTLLKLAEDELKSKNVQSIRIGADLWHYFPGVPSIFTDVCKWFERKGYKFEGYEYDLICKYDDKQFELPQPIKNVTFSLLKQTEKEQLLTFLHKCFPGRWEYEAIQYFKKGGTGREYVVLKKNNEIIGFCRINDAESPFIAQNVYWSPLFTEHLGGIGPLGVDQKERKKGYGIAIIQAGIMQLRKRGINQIVIDWTGLVSFYNKLGYQVWKTYSKYSKSI